MREQADLTACCEYSRLGPGTGAAAARPPEGSPVGAAVPGAGTGGVAGAPGIQAPAAGVQRRGVRRFYTNNAKNAIVKAKSAIASVEANLKIAYPNNCFVKLPFPLFGRRFDGCQRAATSGLRASTKQTPAGRSLQLQPTGPEDVPECERVVGCCLPGCLELAHGTLGLLAAGSCLNVNSCTAASNEAAVRCGKARLPVSCRQPAAACRRWGRRGVCNRR